jgi:hypothetical protein
MTITFRYIFFLFWMPFIRKPDIGFQIEEAFFSKLSSVRPNIKKLKSSIKRMFSRWSVSSNEKGKKFRDVIVYGVNKCILSKSFMFLYYLICKDNKQLRSPGILTSYSSSLTAIISANDIYPTALLKIIRNRFPMSKITASCLPNY